MVKIILKKKFRKRLEKFSFRIQQKVKEVLVLFKNDPFHKILNRHKLNGKMKGLESINVTGDIRIIFNPVTNEIVEIVDIGTHSQLY